MDTDQNLLLGVLALQAGYIDSEQFVEGCALWATRKNGTLVDLLVERGWLTSGNKADLERLSDSKLGQQDGNVLACLAAVADEEVRRVLAILSDSDSQHSLAGLSVDDDGSIPWTEIFPSVQRERYTLARLHAVGSVGQVWLARDMDLGRDVALKEPRPEGTDRTKVYGRFLWEAQITGQLEHPGIVPVYELTRGREGKKPYYTMRFVKGRTLTEAIKTYHRERANAQAGQLEQRALLNAFIGVCNTVGYAHSRGVIHRDLKGQNVLLGDFGEVVVLDWGLAKLMDFSGKEPTVCPMVVKGAGEWEATLDGQVLGTPAYMAPEQAAGRLDLVDGRTDVYGLGAILYELLTGRAPFVGADTQEMLRQVREEEPTRPRAVCPNVSPALEAICLHALAKKPAERYASATELAGEVQRWLADEPVTTYREPWRAQIRRWLGRRRTLVAGLGAAFLVAAVCLAVSTSLLMLANRREREATALTSQREEEVKAERDRTQGSFELARQAVATFCNRVNEDPRLREKDLDGLRHQLLKNGMRFYEKLGEQQSGSPTLQAERGQTLFQIANITLAIGSVAETREAYQKAQALFEKLARDFPAEAKYLRNLAKAHRGLASCYARTGQLHKAEADYRQAALLAERAVHQQTMDAVSRHELATIYLNHGNLYRDAHLRWRKDLAPFADLPDRAQALYMKALAIEEQLVQEFPDVGEYRSHLGRIHNLLGILYQHFAKDKDRAEFSYTKSQGLLDQLLRDYPNDPDRQYELSQVTSNLARLYLETGRLDEAEAACEKAFALRLELADKYPAGSYYQVHLASGFNLLASLRTQKEQLEEAEVACQKAWTILDKLFRKDPEREDYARELYVTYDKSILRAEKTGNAGRALEWHSKAIETLEVTQQSEGPYLRLFRHVHGSRGKTLIAMGRYSEALPDLDRAIEIANETKRDYCRLLRACTWARLGQHAAATAEADTIVSHSPAGRDNLYNAACVYAQASAAVRKPHSLSAANGEQLAEKYASRSLELLNQARLKDFFKTAARVAQLKGDEDLAPLRGREDFREFLRSLEQEQNPVETHDRSDG